MAITHNRLKDSVVKLVHKMYSERGTGVLGYDAENLSHLFEFYKGELTILSGTIPNTVITPLSLFDDTVVRTELFVGNNDATKVLTLYLDAAGTEVIYTLEPKDSITFPAYFIDSIYMQASAPALSFTSWVYKISS